MAAYISPTVCAGAKVWTVHIDTGCSRTDYRSPRYYTSKASAIAWARRQRAHMLYLQTPDYAWTTIA